MRHVGDQSILACLRIAQAERHVVEGSHKIGELTLPRWFESLAELPSGDLPGDMRQTVEADSQLADQRIQYRAGEREKCQQHENELVVPGPGMVRHAVATEHDLTSTIHSA